MKIAPGLMALKKLSINPAEVALRRRLTITLVGLVLLLSLVVLLSAAHGPADVPYLDTAAILLDDLGIDVGVDYTRKAELVVDQIRLPRIITGALVGMALATAGATLQGLFRNPMADPGIIGVSSGGALAGAITIVTGLAAVHVLFTPTAAFLGAMVAAFTVYGIANIGGQFTMGTLILAGVALSSLTGAMVSFVLLNTQDVDAVREVLFWLTGGLDSRLWLHVKIIVGPVLGGIVLIYAFSRALNLMLTGGGRRPVPGYFSTPYPAGPSGDGCADHWRGRIGQWDHRLRGPGGAPHDAAHRRLRPPGIAPGERPGRRHLPDHRRHHSAAGHLPGGAAGGRGHRLHWSPLLHVSIGEKPEPGQSHLALR